MVTRRAFLLGAGSLLLTSGAWGQPSQERARSIHVSGAWSRPTARSAPTGVVYMSVQNTGSSDITIASLATKVAERAEVHKSTRVENVVRMEKVGPLLVPAGKTVELKPDGLHVMLMDLSAPLVAGRAFSITLRLDDESTVDVNVEVMMRAPQPGHHG